MKQQYENELSPEVRERMKKNLVYVGIFGITMLFAGLTSAYIVSSGDTFWLKVKFPKAFWISTACIALSSFTFVLAVGAAKKQHLGRLKAMITATFALGLAFVFFQFKGYGELVDRGVHFSFSKVLVVNGKYGEYYKLKMNDAYLDVQGNDYLIKGKPASAAQMKAIADFAVQLDHVDQKDGLGTVNGLGTEFTIYYNDEPLTYLENQFVRTNGEKLGLLELKRLRFWAENLRDGRGDFFVKGKIGQDFHVFFKGKELNYKDRSFYIGDRKLDPYLQNKANDAADTASQYLYIITFAHLLHIIVTLLFLIRTLIFSYSGRYTSGDTLGLRVTGIFWHFLGLLWFYLLLFLLFYH